METTQSNELSKWLLFAAAIAAVIAAVTRLIIQPLFTAWVFFTIRHEKAKVRELVEEAFKPQIDELVKTSREIRECQGEQGEAIAHIAGRLGIPSK